MDIVRVTQRLRSAADQVYHAWPMMQWQKVAGPGPEVVTQKGREPFAGLALTPGQDVISGVNWHSRQLWQGSPSQVMRSN